MTISKERLEELQHTRGEVGEMARHILELQKQEPVATIDVQRGRPDGNKFALAYSFKGIELPDGVYYLYAAPVPPSQPVMPTGLHPDTAKLVTDFASALAEKLYQAQVKYGYDADWKRDGWSAQCQAHFHQHIAKGDPRDVAAYCAFMWFHGWKTEFPASQPLAVPGNIVTEEHRRVIKMLLKVCGCAFELMDDGCQMEVDGEPSVVVPYESAHALSDALDEIENTLQDQDGDRPNIVLTWSAVPRAALKSLLQLSGNAEPVSKPDTLPENKPCTDAPERIWLQTAGEWPAGGVVGDMTWCDDSQHPDDTLYIRADLVGNSPVIPDGWVLVPAKATYAMIRAAGRAARKYMAEHGGNNPSVIYSAMLAAALPAETLERIKEATIID